MTSMNLFYGERVRLTSVFPSDAQTIARWYEDGEFSRLFDASPAYPKSENSVHKWMDGNERDRDSFTLAMRLLYSDDLIGYVQIDGIQWTHGCGWLAIGIGSPAHRNKGYGTEAMRLSLRFAFHELNLHRLQLSVFGYNEAAIKLYERLGFKREGVLREYLRRDGQRYDMIFYGLLAQEWEKAVSGE
ncbi:MAG: GNAT family protein [Chloroflexota bacterium]